MPSFVHVGFKDATRPEWPFSTLLLLDRLFGVSIVLLSGLSLQESINFGRFLRVLLEWLSSISHINIQGLSSDAVDGLISAYLVSGHKFGFCPHIRRTRRMIGNNSSPIEPSLGPSKPWAELDINPPSIMDENTSMCSDFVLVPDTSEGVMIENPTLQHGSPSAYLEISPEEDPCVDDSIKPTSVALEVPSTTASTTPLTFSQFSSVFRKWHIKLYRSFAKVLNSNSTFKTNSTSYCRTRNALVVLNSFG